MKKLIGVLIFIFFISCASNPPKWYEKIYTDTPYFIYATGEGKTKQEAINSALANASAKIAIVVSSSYNSLQYSYKGNDTSAYSKNSVYDIQTKTNPLTFTDYKILKLEKKDKYYALIKINRYQNAKYMCDNINIEKFDTDDLNILFNYHKILKNINSTIQRLKNINALYPLCTQKLKKALTLKENLEKKYNALSVKILSNDKDIQNIISSILNVKISQNAPVKISAKVKKSFKKVGNYKITALKIDFNVINDKKSKSFSVECAGSSIQDYNVAKSLAYQECKEKLKRIFNN